ncbi:uncharacterized protein PAC_01060 [Phialocephala subalpina]|uniref:Uncharacterized protein n=1 Tax=Phialocephala subalpina TaxID=576137 RepID=A0A1L7WEH1_9HELO|nr:uncharacterized protein PAC_01060 [Phialocephala subalpina]
MSRGDGEGPSPGRDLPQRSSSNVPHGRGQFDIAPIVWWLLWSRKARLPSSTSLLPSPTWRLPATKAPSRLRNEPTSIIHPSPKQILQHPILYNYIYNIMGCCCSRQSSVIHRPAKQRNRGKQANNDQVDGPGGLPGDIALGKVNERLEAHVRETTQGNAGSESPEDEDVSPPDVGRTIPGGEPLAPGRTMTIPTGATLHTVPTIESHEAPVSNYCPILGHGEYQVRGSPMGRGALEICPACREDGESNGQAAAAALALAGRASA